MIVGSLYLIGSAFALFFSVLLFNKPQRRAADWIMFAWLLAVFTHLLDYYFEYAGFKELYPHLLGITDGLPFLYGPCLYLYVRTLVDPPPALRLRDVVHALPLVGYGLIYVPFFLSDASRKRDLYEQGITAVPLLLEIGIIAKLLSLPFYLTLVFRRLRKYEADTRQYHSNTEAVDLGWLRNVVRGMAAFWLFIVGALAADALWGLETRGRSDALIFAALVAGIVGLGYFGVRQGAVFQEGQLSEPEIDTKSPELVPVSSESVAAPPRYRRSGLREEDARDLRDRLLATMETDKLYLESELTADDIARRLRVSRHHITEVLNDHLGRNFYLFVNEYRVEEARRRIVDPCYANLTLLAIALDCGFNSKSSFNSVFKRLTSMTPSQYRRAHAHDDPART